MEGPPRRNGEDDTDKKHTGDYLAEKLIAQITKVGVKYIAAIGSDNTGNTKKARRLVAAEFPTIINFSDPIHHMNLMIGDITSLPEFQDIVEKVKRILTYFNKSWAATSVLAEKRAEQGIGQGLEKIGKTRFATVWRGSNSIQNSLPLIRELVKNGEIAVKEVNELFKERSAALNFEIELIKYNSIIAPVAHSIKSLESTQTTPADVYIFWLAIAASIKEYLGKGSNVTRISNTLAEKITKIINTRY
ncbi:hypothetical protein M422DRAFT_46358 [Sphaerobolus stellatus SS14]|uniref:DUF659 domain-containing protein n=1 Tax=Sphaerobolus stellatus (strain SS14) TaxID=990650 RepID=A0A0C9W2Z1_SPHS4|nr:hypothetical protein M422DRAFT_46358 [Sphaerobolus stellatus SS14]